VCIYIYIYIDTFCHRLTVKDMGKYSCLGSTGARRYHDVNIDGRLGPAPITRERTRRTRVHYEGDDGCRDIWVARAYYPTSSL
jgi:hypothetical protein